MAVKKKTENKVEVMACKVSDWDQYLTLLLGKLNYLCAESN